MANGMTLTRILFLTTARNSPRTTTRSSHTLSAMQRPVQPAEPAGIFRPGSHRPSWPSWPALNPTRRSSASRQPIDPNDIIGPGGLRRPALRHHRRAAAHRRVRNQPTATFPAQHSRHYPTPRRRSRWGSSDSSAFGAFGWGDRTSMCRPTAYTRPPSRKWV